jgi:cellulose synthase/poly-beta-1,6-N-acetylglucosamine synthase-like glycosyltransferase
MICIEKGLRCITQTEAIVLEDVSNDLAIEFKRKIRISSGNFQNLRRFWPLLFKFNWVSFAFFSHKVLRWILPVFLVAMVLQIVQQHEHSLFYELLYFGLLLIPIAFAVDYLSRKRGVHLVWLRFIIHFVSMNLALLLACLGFLAAFALLFGNRPSVISKFFVSLQSNPPASCKLPPFLLCSRQLFS